VSSSTNVWGQILLGVLSWWLAVYPLAQNSNDIEREFPVDGQADYGSAHHDYPATDIFASCGSRVISPVDGVVLEVNRLDRWAPESDLGRDRGGRFLSLRGQDGVRYYASHLSEIRADIAPGAPIRAGENIGRVGHTGSARFTPCHLHFGLSPVCEGTGQWWIRRGVVSPYPFLGRWRAGEKRSPAGAISAWKLEHGCPNRP